MGCVFGHVTRCLLFMMPLLVVINVIKQLVGRSEIKSLTRVSLSVCRWQNYSQETWTCSSIL